ncbi:MAG: SDR family NAD(P)-dependent oxidoreductase, partial [Bacteroidota bacterium]
MKVAFITGGSRGIGYGIAEALLDDGWAVSITGRTEAGVANAVEQLKSSGSDHVLGLTCDVRVMGDQERAVA